MEISVIIINYNTFNLTSDCIESVLKSFKYGKLNGEIIVVDNNSSDDSIKKLKKRFKEYKNIIYIENNQNYGFSKANNQALKLAKGKFILLLNSDTIVNPDTLIKSINYLKEHPKYQILGCKVILGSGELDPACKRSFPTPMSALYHFLYLDKLFPKSKTFGHYNLTYLNEDEIHEVECITGAFLLFKREILNDLHGLSEDYFMYGEDNDFCYRALEKGYKIIYYPEVSIKHFKKASWNGKRNPKVLDAFYDSMLIFYNKFYKDNYSEFTNRLVKTGINVFKGIEHFRNNLKK